MNVSNGYEFFKSLESMGVIKILNKPKLFLLMEMAEAAKKSKHKTKGIK